jgi:methionyl-tRNA formyltransferase
MPLRLVFFGTPEFALPSLRLLLSDSRFEVQCVVTQPDRPRGRGQHVTSSAVKDFALESRLYVYQPEKVRDETVDAFFKRMQPDAVVIIAYGQKIPPNLLAIPRLGWINLHGSLLPRYRGAAPINWAIVNGETRTGLTTMRVNGGMDTGPILLQKEVEIGPDETAPQLTKRMAEAGAPLVAETLIGVEGGTIRPKSQDETQKSMAPQMKKEDGKLDWARSAQELYNQIRGFDPWPSAYTSFRGRHCRVWGKPAPVTANAAAPGRIVFAPEGLLVACGQNTWLRLDEVQMDGKRKILAKEFASGTRLTETDTFQTE